MKNPNKTLKGMGVGRIVVKYHAHGLTLFAVFWSLPSGLSMMFFVFGLHDGASVGRLCGALVFPAIHVCSIAGAIYYWITERKEKVTVLDSKGGIGVGF